MIITRNWLQNWVDISEISTDKILETLNSIGLEVDSYQKIEIPQKVVVGYVKSRRAHENSDHLNICEVDVGDETLQIVCGAKNVEAGQHVAVSLVGAILPSGLEIKPAKLRGEASFGMICSAGELGLPKLNDGIMILDESIGELKLGKELREYAIFNDEIIEVDLTPNRGDCLSVQGVARDLSVRFDLALKDKNAYEEADKLLGIGRLLLVRCDESVGGNFAFRAFEIKDKLQTNLLRKLYLAYAQILDKDEFKNLINYVIHSTGVLVKGYDYNKICNNNEKITIDIEKLPNEALAVKIDNKILSLSGINQDKENAADENSKIIILEASYVKPSLIARVTGEDKSIKGDEQLYRSLRGSEPKLSLGLDLAFKILSEDKNISLYAGTQYVTHENETNMVSFTGSEISHMIGENIDRNRIVKILKKLGFDINVDGDYIFAKIPPYRHDIVNSHDICEEIVRIIGIDNIKSAPLNFYEKNRLNTTYYDYINLRKLRYKAVDNGFYECICYVFDDESRLKELGFNPCKIKILNPLNNELNTLRPTLINHLLDSAERNVKNSRRSVKLFESGCVFDENGTESSKIGFIASGLQNDASLLNSAKPKNVDFIYFASLIQNIIGKFHCEIPKENLNFLSPFEQANIVQNGVVVGYIGRLDSKVEASRDLPKTYVCEIDFEKLKFDDIKAQNYSKFPSISRDLSLVVPNSLRFEKINECIKSLNIATLKEFLPTDIYKDDSLKDASSITIKFTFQDINKTLEDDEIADCMDKILDALKQQLGLNLR